MAGTRGCTDEHVPQLWCAGRVRRALENTCTPLGGGAPDAVLTYGRGLIQVRFALLAWRHRMGSCLRTRHVAPQFQVCLHVHGAWYAHWGLRVLGF